MSVDELYNKHAQITGGKTLFYDWNGANEWLLLKVNGIRANYYDQAMQFVSRITESHNFPYYLAIFAIYALLALGIRKLQGRAGNKHYLFMWLGIFSVLGAAFVSYATIIQLSKAYFSFPRPYVILASPPLHILEAIQPDKSYHSFPSGHVAFISFIVASLWPALSLHMKRLGAFVIILTAWSRLSVGMHFPADVLGGFFIAVTITIIVRWVIYKLYWTCLKIHC